MILVTGATGELGRQVIAGLSQRVPAGQIVAAVRDAGKAKELAEGGVEIRIADYDRPETLTTAFAGAEKILFISSSEVGKRIAQHRAVVDAAQKAGVQLLVYTSILYADTSTLLLAKEHRATEAYIRASGLPFAMLRNGWYTENHTATLRAAIEHGTILGAAGEGRFSSAPRSDYAAAAIAALTDEGQRDQVYELGGDEAYTLTELAAEVAKQAGQTVAYKNLSESEYAAALIGFGLPEAVAHGVADADTGAARGDLMTSTGDLSRLIGRPTVSLQDVVRRALAA